MAVALSQQQNWNIGNSDGRCAACQQQIPPATACWAVLCENPPEARRQDGLPFYRRNYCEACWQSRPADTAGQNAFSHWKTAVPEPNRKPKLLVDDHVLIDLFTRLVGQDDLASLRFRFVLALLLMRKRILRYDGSEALSQERRTALNLTSDQSELWQMTLKGETVEVINPVLTPDQISEVSEQISTILAETI
ncbi:MAG: hypothetical protein ACP5O1_04585 [Phycisphaerae bacterium]